MHTTSFHRANGSLSSQRNTTKSSGRSISITSYPGSGKGGSTFKTGNVTTRLNSKGQCIGSGIKSGNHTTYFGSNGGVVSSLAAFR